MNEISSRRGPTLPRNLPDLALSLDLGRALEHVRDYRSERIPGENNRALFTPHPPSHALREEARLALDALAVPMQPVRPETVHRWLRPIAAGVRNPPTGADFAAHAAAVAIACDGLPSCAFNTETQREALQAFQFFPAAADVFELLARAVYPLEIQRNRMRNLLLVRPDEERHR